MEQVIIQMSEVQVIKQIVLLGTQSVADDEYVLIKIETNGMWGYVSQLDFQLGASDVAVRTESLALDDIDADNSGTSVNLLSTSNAGCLLKCDRFRHRFSSDIDINGYLAIQETDEEFSQVQRHQRNLNEDVGSNGSNYTSNSFKDAYTGSVVLEVNGTEVHTVFGKPKHNNK